MTTEPLYLAHSELRSLVVKAARGAGLAWGLAEEAGWAAEWLARRGLPAADWAMDWLQAAAGSPDPVAVGVAMADRMGLAKGPVQAEMLPDDLPAPGYLLPFLHRIAACRGAVEIVAPGGRVVLVEPDGTLRFGPAWGPRSSGWSVASAGNEALSGRRPVAAAVVAGLEALALHTTVPPSVRSRQGAGSSMTDND